MMIGYWQTIFPLLLLVVTLLLASITPASSSFSCSSWKFTVPYYYIAATISTVSFDTTTTTTTTTTVTGAYAYTIVTTSSSFPMIHRSSSSSTMLMLSKPPSSSARQGGSDGYANNDDDSTTTTNTNNGGSKRTNKRRREDNNDTTDPTTTPSPPSSSVPSSSSLPSSSGRRLVNGSSGISASRKRKRARAKSRRSSNYHKSKSSSPPASNNNNKDDDETRQGNTVDGSSSSTTTTQSVSSLSFTLLPPIPPSLSSPPPSLATTRQTNINNKYNNNKNRGNDNDKTKINQSSPSSSSSPQSLPSSPNKRKTTTMNRRRGGRGTTNSSRLQPPPSPLLPTHKTNNDPNEVVGDIRTSLLPPPRPYPSASSSQTNKNSKQQRPQPQQQRRTEVLFDERTLSCPISWGDFFTSTTTKAAGEDDDRKEGRRTDGDTDDGTGTASGRGETEGSGTERTNTSKVVGRRGGGSGMGGTTTNRSSLLPGTNGPWMDDATRKAANEDVVGVVGGGGGVGVVGGKKVDKRHRTTPNSGTNSEASAAVNQSLLPGGRIPSTPLSSSYRSGSSSSSSSSQKLDLDLASSSSSSSSASLDSIIGDDGGGGTYSSSTNSNKDGNTSSTRSSSSLQSSLPSLDGVLPVSELFYRPTSIPSQDITNDDDDERLELNDNDANDDVTNDSGSTSSRQSTTTTTNKTTEKSNNSSKTAPLPFTTEQSDQIVTTNNKIRVRRNNAAEKRQQQQAVGKGQPKEGEKDIGTTTGMTTGGSSGGNDDGSDSSSTNNLTTKIRSSTLASTTTTNKTLSSLPSSSLSSDKNGTGRRRITTITPNPSSSTTKTTNPLRPQGARRKHGKGGRKLIRRGMEMLVGGEAINADPPLRTVELRYGNGHGHGDDDDSDDLEEDVTPVGEEDWANIIATNSREFGPLLHTASVEKVGDLSRGLYCEHFVSTAKKWKVCPKDLDALVKGYRLDEDGGGEGGGGDDVVLKGSRDAPTKDEIPGDTSLDGNKNKVNDDTICNGGGEVTDQQQPMQNRGFAKAIPSKKSKLTTTTNNNSDQQRKGSGVGFMSPSTFQTPDGGFEVKNKSEWKPEDSFTLGGELKFSLGLTRAQLESGRDGRSGAHILRRVLRLGIGEAIRADTMGFDVAITELVLTESSLEKGSGGTTTEFTVEFNLLPKKKMEYGAVERAAKRINIALARATDNGDIALAMGAAAKAETAWPTDVRDRVIEEFLFDAEDEDEGEEEDSGGVVGDAAIDDMDDFDLREVVPTTQLMTDEKTLILPDQEEYDGPFGMPGDTTYAKDDIYLGGGNGGVFSDYSKESINSSPFQGTLGPILLDAVVQRAIQRQPRVIAIGDVHGCLDELQMLLRRCDYRPGDLVVFLGDLVSKGPDSLAVVQMAREIGAIGVRGNHDFEVVRWHQAIKSGADPPVIGSEHYRIASTLSKADLKWMYSLPWYITSKELGALFVHAGFVSGIRLGKQNPRLMMNMRSILPDGTVTSKFFNNWPWARLWDGPKTVLFGHDADRGLQQYEHAIGLDTGCVYGGRLTACILPEKRLVSVNAKREYFHYRRKRFD